ncbi:hypothetical protein A7K93_00470 [Candidatus Methylacidiphilum fumarolicum]|nr:hypothetical protein A7K73_03280 [Candidatus Methylacidiphilum fumarolicum]TFE74814.1 hypothetical protein A7K72_03435 [Candidatus Methylacidiphilum fumarolicum]TFE76059.1 hypothetical protein A7K93_00470 [Candidatus Methylacidiphilum fumarolicum]TFE76355.1 hypothetical protein A7D33_00470 [Candidatus Methylacidiphilum fumarolicum]
MACDYFLCQIFAAVMYNPYAIIGYLIGAHRCFFNHAKNNFHLQYYFNIKKGKRPLFADDNIE